MCPIYSKMILMYTASLAMIYKSTNSAYVADDMTVFIIWGMLRTAPLFCGIVESLDGKKLPLALLCAFGLLKYLASLCAANFMSLALNVSTAYYCVAM